MVEPTPRPAGLPPSFIALTAVEGQPVYIAATRVAAVMARSEDTTVVWVGGLQGEALVQESPAQVFAAITEATR